MSAWWISVEHAPGRTQDHRIHARSRWAAWWLGCQLWGQQNVRMVREVR